jgi:hypothetical protein
MRIVKTINPLAAIEFLPLYVELPGFDRKTLAENLFTQLTEKPNETLVLALINDINSIVGMVVAYIREDDKDVRIWQAASVPGVDKKWSEIMLCMVIAWTKSMGKNKITAETTRHSRLWERRWGFKAVNNCEVMMEVQ